jgi:hypothetical protein
MANAVMSEVFAEQEKIMILQILSQHFWHFFSRLFPHYKK